MVHTPGHTDGSICFIYQSSAFTGDTLFAGSIGGIFGDRFGYDDLLQATKLKIFSLPDDTVVLPGHGPPSTIGQDRAHNAPLEKQDRIGISHVSRRGQENDDDGAESDRSHAIRPGAHDPE